MVLVDFGKVVLVPSIWLILAMVGLVRLSWLILKRVGLVPFSWLLFVKGRLGSVELADFGK